MGHKSHSQKPGRRHRFRGSGYRTEHLWLFPTDAGKAILHIQEEQDVEGGARKFLAERLGWKVVRSQLGGQSLGNGADVLLNTPDRGQISLGRVIEKPKDYVPGQA